MKGIKIARILSASPGSPSSLSVPIPNRPNQYFIAYTNKNGNYNLVVNNGWSYTIYAVANTGHGTLNGIKHVETTLGNTNTITVNIPMYTKECSKTCGVDALGQCNPLCYNATIVSDCKRLDKNLTDAFVNNCQGQTNNNYIFTATDGNKKYTLTCCSHVSPYIYKPSTKKINVTNSSNVKVVTKQIYYKNIPAIIKLIVTS